MKRNVLENMMKPNLCRFKDSTGWIRIMGMFSLKIYFLILAPFMGFLFSTIQPIFHIKLHKIQFAHFTIACYIIFTIIQHSFQHMRASTYTPAQKGQYLDLAV